MAAVISTSLGPDTTSTRAAASGHAESAGKSFVDSLAENAAHAGETPLDVGGQTKPTSAAEREGSTPGKTAAATLSTASSEVKSAISIVEKLPNEAQKLKPSGALEIGKTTGLVANKTKSSVTGAVPQGDTKPSETNAATQPTMPDDKSVLVIPGSEISHGQKLANNVTDGGVPDDTDGVEDPGTQIAVEGATPATDIAVKQVITGKIGDPVFGKSQDDSTGKATNSHSASAKTDKTAKAEDKKDKAGVVVNAAGVDVQPLVLAQVFANSTGNQQSGSGDAEPEVLSATSAVTSSQSGGIAVAANGKKSKAAANTGKPDGSTVKAPGFAAVENPLSQKTEADATKPESATAASPDTDKSKPQSTVVSVTEIGQLHAVSVATGSVTGSGLTHDAGVGLHTTEAVSHAVATAQASSNLVDTTSSADAGHKTLTATPTSLEVGVSDGTHGWLKIRAEMAEGGSVNTSLSTSSSAGQEMLHRELPSLAAFLKSEHVAVNAMVVQPMPTSGSDARGFFAGTSGSEHGQAQQSGGQGSEGRQSPANPTPTHAGASVPYSRLGAVGEDEMFSSTSYVQGGGWLSVRA
ncbi:MAG: hypothetical protein ABI177_09975 [Edaphobacter sp.]